MKHRVSTTTRFRIFFALQFAAIGVFMPYVALYLTSLELTGGQIGLLLALMPLLGFLAQPFWGFITDVSHSHRPALVVASFGVAGSMVGWAVASDFRMLLLFAILHAVFRAPITILGNALALEFLAREPSNVQYGSLRLWGSIGFALASFVVGAVLVGYNIWWIIPVYALINLLLGLVALTFPNSEVYGQVRWQEGIRLIVTNRVLALFLLGTLLVGSTLGIVNSYLAVYLSDLSAAGWVIGATLAISALIEVPLMANVPAFVRRWGVRLVFIGGVAMLPLRYVLYIVVDQPILALPIQVTHSIAMMSLLVVGVLYVDRLLTPEWRASGQALYFAGLAGIGSSIGLYVAGIIYSQAGITPVWLMCAVLATAGTMVYGLVVRSGPIAAKQQEATV